MVHVYQETSSTASLIVHGRSVYHPQREVHNGPSRYLHTTPHQNLQSSLEAQRAVQLSCHIADPDISSAGYAAIGALMENEHETLTDCDLPGLLAQFDLNPALQVPFADSPAAEILSVATNTTESLSGSGYSTTNVTQR